MSRYICIGFTDFMPKGKIFLDYTNMFSPNKYQTMINDYQNICDN